MSVCLAIKSAIVAIAWEHRSKPLTGYLYNKSDEGGIKGKKKKMIKNENNKKKQIKA